VRNTKITAVALSALLASACAPQGEKLLARAETSLAQGEYRAAMIDLKNYVAKNPEDARARADLGLALLELGDLNGAETEVGKARALGVDQKAIIVVQCRVLIARDAYQRVLDECTALGDPAIDPDLAIVRGEALLGMQRYGDARTSFESVAAARPASLELIQGLATAVYGIEGLPAARKVFESAPGEVRSRPRYWLALGSIEMRGGDLAAAERAFAGAVDATSKDEESRDRLSALAGLAEAQLRQGKTEEAAKTSDELLKAAPKSSFAKLLRAQAAAGAGDLATARMLLEETVSADPDNAQARIMLGVVNMQQGNLGQAEMHLARVVARDPDNVRAQQLLASVRSQLQSPEQSLDALKPALDRSGADPSLLALASQLSLQSGNRDAALGYLDKAAETAGAETPEAQLQLAGGYLAAGEVDRAISILEAMPAAEGAAGVRRETLLVAALLRQGKTQEALGRAEELAAKPGADTSAHAIAGAIYAAVGQTDKARGEWNRVLEARPDDPATRMNLGRLDLRAGNPDAAAQQFEKILAGDPQNVMATLGLAAVAQVRQDDAAAEKLVKKAVDDHPESAEVRLVQSQFYLGRRNFTEARSAAEEALRLSPRSAAAANAAGLAALGDGDVASAIASFKQAMQFAPRGGFHLNLARAYVVDGKPGDALRTLDEAVRSSGADPATLALAATIALQSRDVSKARSYVDGLQKLAPESQVTLRLEGDLAAAGRQYRNALDYYEKASRSGNDAALAVARYRAGVGAGVPDPQQPLEEWLQRSPGDASVRALLAEYEQQRGNVDAAIAGYEKSLELAPDNVLALNNLAGLYQQRKDPRAMSLAQRAYDAAPNNPAVQDTYGWALVGHGEVARGLDLIRQAAKAMPGNAEIQYHLGTALARQGEVDEARRVLEGVMANQPQGPIKDGAQSELARLGK
jgi:putative PEP-CTERM system TPR-repeat lipoprotein